MADALATGNLMILDAHTDAPKVFWKGKQLIGVYSLRVSKDNVKLYTNQAILLPEDLPANVIVKQRRVKV